MDYFTITIIASIICLASFFATVAGFGFALVAVPLLSIIMPLKSAVVLILMITVIQRLITMYHTRNKFQWNTVLLTSLGSLFGTIPGSFVLKFADAEILELFLGIVLLLVTILMSLEFTIPVKNKFIGRIGAGFLSGFFCASTSISGPPIALYFLNEREQKDIMRANMIWFFGISGIVTVSVSYFMGNIPAVDNWLLFAAVFPAMFLGIILGERMFYHLNQHLFRRLSLLVVFAGAVMMLIDGIKAY